MNAVGALINTFIKNYTFVQVQKRAELPARNLQINVRTEREKEKKKLNTTF